MKVSQGIRLSFIYSLVIKKNVPQIMRGGIRRAPCRAWVRGGISAHASYEQQCFMMKKKENKRKTVKKRCKNSDFQHIIL